MQVDKQLGQIHN